MKKETYKVLKKSKNLDEVIIEASGTFKNTFNIGEITQIINQSEIRIKEAEATKELHEAKVKNVEKHYPQVKALSPKMLSAAYLYYENTKKAEMFNEAIKEGKQKILTAKKLLKEISKQTGLKL